MPRACFLWDPGHHHPAPRRLKDAFAAAGTVGPLPLITGILSATVVSWLAIDWLLKFLQRHSTWVFVGYRLLFGVVLLAWWARYGAH